MSTVEAQCDYWPYKYTEHQVILFTMFFLYRCKNKTIHSEIIFGCNRNLVIIVLNNNMTHVEAPSDQLNMKLARVLRKQ